MSPEEFAQLMAERPAGELIDELHPKLGDQGYRAKVHACLSSTHFTKGEFYFKSDGWHFEGQRNAVPSLAALRSL